MDQSRMNEKCDDGSRWVVVAFDIFFFGLQLK